ncbi:O-antigen ligase family protein [Paraburkholderia xenovorans]|uniref:O-antigen ligase family protein n=1 Tax=Paraburkholderia xenovorans TaxID=36873 RepID=UPI0038B7DDBC
MIFAPSLIWLSTALLFLAPAVNLVWRGGTGYCFFALVALALGAAIANRRLPGFFTALRTYSWFTTGMLAFVVVLIAQQLLLGYWMPRQFDSLARFVFALPLFLLLRQFPSRNLRMVGWGCAAGAFGAGAWALVDQLRGGWTDASRLNNYYTNAIPFGDTALLLAFLAIFTLGWDGPRNGYVLTLKLLALISGGYASYLSGTRGGWLAIPIFVILLGGQFHWFAHKKRLLVAALAIVVCGAALLSTERVANRVEAVTADVTSLRHGDDNTSVGLRLQLWHASWRLFTEHPVFGVGKGKLVDALGDMADHGEAKAEIVNERAHSDFFSTIAETGVIGTLCLILLYFGLSVYFWRNRASADPATRAAACSGLAVSFSTIVFGLTIDVLVPVMVTALLALLSATFLAVIDARKRELQQPAGEQAGR